MNESVEPARKQRQISHGRIIKRRCLFAGIERQPIKVVIFHFGPREGFQRMQGKPFPCRDGCHGTKIPQSNIIHLIEVKVTRNHQDRIFCQDRLRRGIGIHQHI